MARTFADFRPTAQAVFRDAVAALRASGKKFWMTDGTLLGFFREGDLIGHDLDIDFAMFATDHGPEVGKSFLAKGFCAHKTYGKIERGLEESFVKNGIKVDIFYFYETDGFVWHAAWLNGGKNLQDDIIRYAYPKDLVADLQSVSFLGTQAPAPANIQRYVVLKYGESWQTPDRRWRWDTSPKNVIDGPWLITRKITAIIKTHDRPRCLDRLLTSLRQHYPFLKVLVGDDGQRPARVSGENLEYHRFPFDIGLSAGRNRLLKQVETPYFLLLDDDYIFTSETRIERLAELLDKNPEVDIMAGQVLDLPERRPMKYHGRFDLENKTLRYQLGHIRETEDFRIYDVVPNFFLGRARRVWDAGGWDPDLKLSEHADFFLRMRGELTTACTDQVSIDHLREQTQEYRKQHSRIHQYYLIFMQKHGIETIVDFSGKKKRPRGRRTREPRNHLRRIYKKLSRGPAQTPPAPSEICYLKERAPTLATLEEFRNLDGIDPYRAIRGKLLQICLDEVRLPGPVAEFGVYKGFTANIIHQLFPDRDLFLFDSFEGLQEDWFGKFKKGTYQISKEEIPRFESDNVELFVGFFQDTLPGFRALLKEPLAFLHIDCDTYSSTKAIFDHLGDAIAPGSLLLFDEYFNYSGWELHEFKAFLEWVEAYDRRFEYIGKTDYMQALIRITK